jgi:ketosteroid isomerase-like protein
MAYCWNHLSVTMTPIDGGAMRTRSGYTLSIFRKENGNWVIARDANLML